MHQTPSILTQGSNSAEVITDGINGYLGVNKMPEDFADSIQAIFADRNTFNKVSKGARETLGLTWSQIMPEVVDRYRSIIKRKSK